MDNKSILRESLEACVKSAKQKRFTKELEKLDKLLTKEDFKNIACDLYIVENMVMIYSSVPQLVDRRIIFSIIFRCSIPTKNKPRILKAKGNVVDLLKQNANVKSDRELQKIALMILSNLASEESCKLALFQTKGFVEFLIFRAKTEVHDLEIKRLLMILLLNLSHKTNKVAMFHQEGLIDLLLNSAMQHENDLDIKKYIVMLLMNLAVDPQNKEPLFLYKGVMPLLMRLLSNNNNNNTSQSKLSMEQQEESKIIRVMVYNMLASLAINSTNQKGLCKYYKFVDLLIATIMIQPQQQQQQQQLLMITTSPEEKKIAFQILMDLASNDEIKIQLYHHENLIKVLCENLKQNSNQDWKRSALLIISHLSCEIELGSLIFNENPLVMETVMSYLNDFHAASFTNKALIDHQQQMVLLTARASLTTFMNMAVDMINKIPIMKLPKMPDLLVELATSPITLHPSNLDIQKLIISCLLNLSVHPECKMILFKTPGLTEMLEKAIQVNSKTDNEKEIVVRSLMMISSLISDSEIKSLMFSKNKSIVNALVNRAKWERESETITEWLFLNIQSFAMSDENKAELLDMGIMELLIKATRAADENSKQVQQEIFEALAALAHHHEAEIPKSRNNANSESASAMGIDFQTVLQVEKPSDALYEMFLTDAEGLLENDANFDDEDAVSHIIETSSKLSFSDIV